MTPSTVVVANKSMIVPKAIARHDGVTNVFFDVNRYITLQDAEETTHTILAISSAYANLAMRRSTLIRKQHENTDS